LSKKTQSYELQEGEYLALAEFRYQIRTFLRHTESEVANTGLNPQQYQLLLAIKGLPKRQEATITVLAERLQLTTTAWSNWLTGARIKVSSAATALPTIGATSLFVNR